MKKNLSTLCLALFLAFQMSGCQSTHEANINNDVLFQYSTLNSLLAGEYDGNMTFGELKEHGDFGLGTFNALDGEMVQIDHTVYQVKTDGVAYEVNDSMKTPFSVVTFFETDQTLSISETLDCEDLKTQVDSMLPSLDVPYALKIEGTFSYMKTRSVPKQAQPYPPLTEVVAIQTEFEFSHIEGTLIGFRLPDYMEGSNAVGYHFHFINSDRNAGGHVLNCKVKDVKIMIDHKDAWYVEL